jgi:hypothetical protein
MHPTKLSNIHYALGSFGEWEVLKDNSNHDSNGTILKLSFSTRIRHMLTKKEREEVKIDGIRLIFDGNPDKMIVLIKGKNFIYQRTCADILKHKFKVTMHHVYISDLKINVDDAVIEVIETHNQRFLLKS